MAAAVTSGVVAQMIQAGREVDLTAPLPPNAIKGILEYTAFPLPAYDSLTQGAGALNGAGAVHLAGSIRPGTPLGEWWLVTSIDPFTTIGSDSLSWAQQMLWGDRVVWGNQIYTSDPAWQTAKVTRAGLAPFFRDIFFTGRVQSKAEVVESLAGRFTRLTVVDNDPRELDLITARRAEVETFWISRVPPEALSGSDAALRERFREARNYATLPAEFPHRRVSTLDEVPL